MGTSIEATTVGFMSLQHVVYTLIYTWLWILLVWIFCLLCTNMYSITLSAALLVVCGMLKLERITWIFCILNFLISNHIPQSHWRIHILENISEQQKCPIIQKAKIQMGFINIIWVSLLFVLVIFLEYFRLQWMLFLSVK